MRKISSYGQFRQNLKNHLFGIWEITAQCCINILTYLLTYIRTSSRNKLCQNTGTACADYYRFLMRDAMPHIVQIMSPGDITSLAASIFLWQMYARKFIFISFYFRIYFTPRVCTQKNNRCNKHFISFAALCLTLFYICGSLSSATLTVSQYQTHRW